MTEKQKLIKIIDEAILERQGELTLALKSFHILKLQDREKRRLTHMGELLSEAQDRGKLRETFEYIEQHYADKWNVAWTEEITDEGLTNLALHLARKDEFHSTHTHEHSEVNEDLDEWLIEENEEEVIPVNNVNNVNKIVTGKEFEDYNEKMRAVILKVDTIDELLMLAEDQKFELSQRTQLFMRYINRLDTYLDTLGEVGIPDNVYNLLVDIIESMESAVEDME